MHTLVKLVDAPAAAGGGGVKATPLLSSFSSVNCYDAMIIHILYSHAVAGIIS